MMVSDDNVMVLKSRHINALQFYIS